ncbi:hypothetical protein M409DRAFT_68779 [Zasmidium cellare ATCC 36951]|uniref:Potassium channel domain-containing protein n=1 Tax=Zasmidium cellare ATCC 36951 TaxID=1080233 RepID=A0A6A6C804_ZASCE|nr:uncharacterized protein M409DRAFT_68779 [Zasmidium cellare ATCC 36951]KAF2163185.1 hypothetical protein M409DRAFT_68779 [Zasmidium cellare ATCC 36951]
MSTTDPGIEDGIKQAANDVEKDKKMEEDERAEQEDLTQPDTWWFASTVNPLLAATFGPIANGFSICALVYSWRSYIPPGASPSEGVRIADPHWLIAINAVSLACALVGNASLLLNMAQRLSFRISQPITITGFFMAGVLLIGDMAGLTSSPTYYITDPRAIPAKNHALTSAYYYAIWAAAIYIIIGLLMCLTVYGASAGHYAKEFNLTPSQRTLMLQTMSFVAYELLGAWVFSAIEGWKYLDGVYWAQVTLLTIGFGDFAPTKRVTRGLIFPYAIGGILMVGLVVGSIRTLVLERGQEKIAARITEKRRETAVHNVDERRQTIRIGWFSKADFSTNPSLTPAQRREEEFKVMRKVQKMAERERRYIALSMSLSFALILWFVGAVIFKACETEQGWSYFQSLYFTFIALLTIGYGDLTPVSNSGKAFFVIWSMLSVPSLTILISNMGDTVVKWFAEFTDWIASITVLPEQGGRRMSSKRAAANLMGRLTDSANDAVGRFTAPGILGETDHVAMDGKRHFEMLMNRLAQRLEQHVEEEELEEALKAEAEGDDLERDIHFYHYVLSRESRNVQKDLAVSPPKKYSWGDWEYFLKIIGNQDETPDFPGQEIPNDLWSWLSDQSPLMSSRTEAEWILERLSAALVRELNRQRKGQKKRPPISMAHVARVRELAKKAEATQGVQKEEAEGAVGRTVLEGETKKM